MSAARPPFWARWLLRCLCDPQHLEAVEGDIEELFGARTGDRGRAHASLRCLTDVVSISRTPYARVRRRGARRSGASVRRGARRAPQPSLSQQNQSPRAETIVDNLMQDLKFALRGLATSPAFAAVVILTLGLGIGANTAIFSVVNGVLLQPLPYYDADRIVRIAEIDPSSERDRSQPMASQQLYLRWRESGTTLADIAMYTNQTVTMIGTAEPIRLAGAAVSPPMFRLLGVDAAEGRTFTAAEETPGEDHVIVLSHRAWQRYFGGAPGLVGTQLQIDGRSRTLIGIMPAGFAFPDPETEFWVPMLIQPPGGSPDDQLAQQASRVVRQEREVRAGGGPGGGSGAPGRGGAGPGGGDGRGGRGPEPEAHMELLGQVVGRLADGVDLEPAAEEGTTLVRALREESPGDREATYVDVARLQDEIVAPVRPAMTLLMGAVGFVLLIACANVANLMLARSAGRSKETAVRSALGAGRLQIVRQLFVEGVVLATFGGIVGLLLATLGLSILHRNPPQFIPRLENASLDTWALAFTLAISLLTGILFSLMPACGAAALDLTRALKQDAGGDRQVLGQEAFRKLLVAAELAVSMVLLVGAGLLVSSFVRLASVDPGYDPDNVLAVDLQMPQARYTSAEQYLSFFDEAIPALEAIPGVLDVTLASVDPTREANIRIGLAFQEDQQPGTEVTFGIRIVEPSYFETLRVDLVAGRGFAATTSASSVPVAMVNESAARAIFPDEEPVGRLFPFMGGQELEIVGVVADARTAGVDPTASPEVFLPLAQAPAPMVPGLFRRAGFLIRTGPAPLTVLPEVRSRLAQLAPQAPLFRAATLSDEIAASVAGQRFYAALVSAFAALAVALAAVGIYGLLSYLVQQRVRETAIRRALGAPGGAILRRIVMQGMTLAAVGLLIGIVVAMSLTRLLESELYETEPTDPLTLVACSAVFLLVTLAAILVPARRATRIDPMEVMRYEG